MKESPTSRTLKLLRGMGHLCQIVERWNSFAKVRQDLFDVIDIVSLDVDVPGVLGVQCCAAASHANRLSKVLASDKAYKWVKAENRLWVVSWGKRGARGAAKKWEPRIDHVTIGMFAEASTCGS